MSAAAQVEGFYRWYLRRAAQEPEFPNRPGDAEPLKRFLTPHFLASYRQRAEATDADPFLAAQDSYDEWMQTVRAEVIQQRADAALVQVTFGPPPEPAHRIEVIVRRLGEQWLIDSAALPEEAAAAAR